MREKFKSNTTKILYLLITTMIVLLAINKWNETIKANAETIIWDGSIAEEFAGGDGTKENPYQIENGSQLAGLAEYGSKYKSDTLFKAYYILTNDIYLNDIDNWEKWRETESANRWTSISGGFEGVFDGGGYVIYGMYCKDAYGSGLFRELNGGTIKNLGIEKSCITGISSFVYELNRGLVDNCHYSGFIVANNYWAGGLVGTNRGSIVNSYNTGEISVIEYYPNDKPSMGGIAAVNDGTISNCYNSGNISDDITYSKALAGFGGIAGRNTGLIQECYNKGTLSGINISWMGGITGYSKGTIKSCYNTGKIIMNGAGREGIGGIVGYLEDGTIDTCHNDNTINCGLVNNYVGGIAGQMESGIIKKCYNKGSITAGKNDKKFTADKNCIGIGGVLGGQDWYYKDSAIISCSNTGTITTGIKSHKIGGIAGYFDNKLYNSVNKGKITAGNDCEGIGGIIGETLFGTIFNCHNSGAVNTNSSDCIGGIAGNLDAYAVFGEGLPDIEPKIANCSNIGSVGGKNCVYVGGIAGESYQSSYNSYNAGTVSGSWCVGGIIGRKTFGENNIPSNCYYLKGCAKVVNPLYKEDNKPNTYGTVVTKSQLKSTTLTQKLNQWAKTHYVNDYSLWKNPTGKINSGYPYLLSLGN